MRFDLSPDKFQSYHYFFCTLKPTAFSDIVLNPLNSVFIFWDICNLRYSFNRTIQTVLLFVGCLIMTINKHFSTRCASILKPRYIIPTFYGSSTYVTRRVVNREAIFLAYPDIISKCLIITHANASFIVVISVSPFRSLANNSNHCDRRKRSASLMPSLFFVMRPAL